MCKAGGVVMPLPLDNKSKVALVFLCFNCGLRLIWPKGKCSQNTTSNRQPVTPVGNEDEASSSKRVSCCRSHFVAGGRLLLPLNALVPESCSLIADASDCSSSLLLSSSFSSQHLSSGLLTK